MDRTGRTVERQRASKLADRQGRGKGIQTDMPSQYREDVGYKMTDEQYEEYKGKYTKWDQDLSGYQEQLTQANSQLKSATNSLNKEKSEKEKEIDAAKARLDKESNKTMSSLYTKQQKNWVTVKTFDTSGTKVEAYYKLPKSVANQVAGVGYDHAWFNNGSVLNIIPKVKGRVRGKELHELLTSTTGQLKEEFYKKNLPSYTKSREEISQGYGQLNSARQSLIENYNQQVSQLSSQKSDVSASMQRIGLARNEYTAATEQRKFDYEEKKKARRALLGSL